MKSNRINLAIEALETIRQNQSLKDLLSKESILTYSESTSVIEVDSDKEDTIQDYMLICGYTRVEAEDAYNELNNY